MQSAERSGGLLISRQFISTNDGLTLCGQVPDEAVKSD